ncbi:anthranilate phosphoribosyltransferase [Kibdelosporangium philippinense]|uniref:Anthranilate phosphoribosyltransferase n=1 Tax=Kibdelosporangium philippinense TaxID=211113 RepID=A0ABS8ZW87_9PSEU|nr:anthranilate phosphoribosyltransferase [Kibdelosporangium philippinense]MCE7011961.1 anthranilate phosphoribosyltransferase [Kibdelosporangium philippinense]
MTRDTWPALLNHLVVGGDLTADDTSWAMNEIMSGNATNAQIAGFAVGLRSKGETPDEISGMAAGMLRHATRVSVTGRAVDVVGTGGDRSGSVNISTMSAIVTAAAGVPVVKHGNRSASSKAGTADVLEVLGVAIGLGPAEVAQCVDELSIGFCFAPRFHPALRHAGPVRSELGIPTAFNVLGPLTNPAQPASGLIGCAFERLAPVMAEVFALRGASVLVVRGDDGLDEITTCATTSAWVVDGGTVTRERIDPATFGLDLCTPEDLRGGDAKHNAEVVRQVLAGEEGHVRNAVLLNAAGAVAAYRGFTGDLAADIAAGLSQVAEAVDSGAATSLLERWAAVSSALAK